jgi:hypothetical protein
MASNRCAAKWRAEIGISLPDSAVGKIPFQVYRGPRGFA